MSELLSSITGGNGGRFVSEGIVSGILSAGQTGELLSVPKVPNKSYRIRSLYCASTATQAGISLTTDELAIESESILSEAQPTATAETAMFFIGDEYAASTLGNGARGYKSVNCSSFSIDKNAGNTTEQIIYAYEIGEYKS